MRTRTCRALAVQYKKGTSTSIYSTILKLELEREREVIMGRYSICTNCLRIIFILLNCVFLLLGAGIGGLGSWLLYLGEEHDYSVITGHTLVSGAALLLSAGVITLVIAGVGIIGVCGMWRPLLLIYIILVIFVALIEVAAGITGLMFRDEVANQVEDRMFTAMEDYRSSSSSRGYRGDVNGVVDYVQKTFECCGVNSSVDWFIVNPNVTITDGNMPPRDCLCTVGVDGHCAQFNFTYIPPGSQDEQDAVYEAWNRGCLTYVQDNLDTVAISVGLIGFVVAGIELVGVAIAIGLFVCIAKRSSYTYV